jgi:hypothetical protein
MITQVFNEIIRVETFDTRMTNADEVMNEEGSICAEGRRRKDMKVGY